MKNPLRRGDASGVGDTRITEFQSHPELHERITRMRVRARRCVALPPRPAIKLALT
jgi:hypothetical protein